jgi:hypothetical protein
MHIQSALSTEYVRVAVGAIEAGIVEDPSGDTLQMAFPATGVTPVAGDWKSATWESDLTTTPATYYARALVGPLGVITLVAGVLYDVYVRIVDNPETVIRNTGALAIL